MGNEEEGGYLWIYSELCEKKSTQLMETRFLLSWTYLIAKRST